VANTVQTFLPTLPTDRTTRSVNYAGKLLQVGDTIANGTQAVAQYLADSSVPPNLTASTDLTLVGDVEIGSNGTSVNWEFTGGISGNTYYWGVSFNTVVSAESFTRYYIQPVTAAPL